MKRRLALALVLLLATSGYTYREDRALQVARAAWRTLPCEGHVAIERGPLEAFGIGDPDAGAAALAPCTIAIEPWAASLPWPFYCTLVVHEVGHLLGYGHSPDPKNVMYAEPSNYWRCNHSWRWTFARNGRSG